MLDNLRFTMAYMIAPSGLKEAYNGNFMQAILGASGGGFGRRSLSSTPELLEAYNRQPWLRAAVHKISYSVSTVPWRVFVARGRNGKVYDGVRKLQKTNDWRQRQRMMKSMTKEVEFVEIEDHPILDVLSSGTELFPGTLNTQLSQAYIDLVGESFQLKERNGRLNNPRTQRGVVGGLVPVPPHWVSELPTPGKPFYEIRFGSSGVGELVPKEDVIFFRDPNPLNPYGRGSGISRALGDELQANEAASRTIRSRLENNSIPPFIAMPEAEGFVPDDVQLARVREEWQRRLRGPDKSGFVHFLKTKFKFEKLGNTFEELSLIPLLQNQRDTIMQVFGIPPEILGILTNSNRATIEAAETLYGMHVVKPRMEFLRSGYQRSLVPEFDDRLILEFDSPVPEDKEFELRVMQAMSWAFMADEIREKGGQEILPDESGRVFGVPAAVILQTSLVPDETEEPEPEEPEDEPEDDPDDEEDPEDDGDGEDEPEEEPEGDDPAEEGKRLTGAAADLKGKIKLWGGVPVRVNETPNGKIDHLSIPFANGGVVRGGSYLVGSDTPELFVPMRRDGSEAALNNIVNVLSDEATIKVVIPILRDIIKEEGERQMSQLLKPGRHAKDEISIAFDVQDPAVLKYLSEEAGDRIVGINKKTRKAVKAALMEGLKNGESVNQLARRLRSTYSGFKGRRSVTIARTESIGALNAGQVAGTKQAGFEGKQWLSTRDGQVRDTHAPGTGMDGQIVGINENFVSPSGAAGPFPGAMGMAAEDINCRCTTLAVAKVDDEARGWPKWLDTEDKRVQYWRAMERQRVPIERKLRRVWRRVFELQEQELLRALHRLIDQ